MNFKKTLSLTLLASLTAGCGALESDPFASLIWRDFTDLDNSTKQIAIQTFEVVTPQKSANRTAKEARFFQRQNSKAAERDIGTGNALIAGGSIGKPAQRFIVLQENGKDRAPDNSQDIASLQKAKKINFYEAGPGILSHAVFTAPNGICKDFKGNGLNVHLATNYYFDNKNVNERTVTNIKGKLSAKGPELLSFKPIVKLSDQAEKAKITQDLQQNGSKLTLKNLDEKVTLFSRIICQ